MKLELNRLIDKKAKLKEHQEDCDVDDGEEQLDDFNDVCKVLEEEGWYKGPRKELYRTEYDWSDGFEFIKGTFNLFSENLDQMLLDEGMEESSSNRELWRKKELEELKLLHEHRLKQFTMSDEEFEGSENRVPFQKYTSSHPEFQWRLDNSRCGCGNCHLLSGTRSRDCWVFLHYGCNFSISTFKYFKVPFQWRNNYSPVFDPLTREQLHPLLLKDGDHLTKMESERLRQQSGVFDISEYKANQREVWRAMEALNTHIR